MVNTNKTDVLTPLGRQRVLHEVKTKFIYSGMIGMFYVGRPYFIPLVSFYTEHRRYLRLIVYLKRKYNLEEDICCRSSIISIQDHGIVSSFDLFLPSSSPLTYSYNLSISGTTGQLSSRIRQSRPSKNAMS